MPRVSIKGNVLRSTQRWRKPPSGADIDSPQRLGGGGWMAASKENAYAVRMLKTSLSRAAEQKRTWDANLDCENEFWTNWLQGRGMSESEEFRRRIDPTTPIQEHLKSLIVAPAGSRIDILDVGAGPVTALGAVWPGCDLRVTAIDPLAAQYNESLARFGVTPPVQTRPGDAEHLLDEFEPESFDIVYCRNALDHSYDPMLGLCNMFTVAKVGGVVRLEQSVNEGENQQYQGLHQWNFDVEDGRFVMWNKVKRSYVDERLPRQAKIACEVCKPARDGLPHWLNVTIMKTRRSDSSDTPRATST